MGGLGKIKTLNPAQCTRFSMSAPAGIGFRNHIRSFLAQGCQVWPFRGPKNNFGLFLVVWPRNFLGLTKCLAFFKSIEVYII